jgi:hypothetical protein
MVNRTPPDDDLAFLIQHLVPDPHDKGLGVAVQLAILDK